MTPVKEDLTNDITNDHPDVEIDSDSARFGFDDKAGPEDDIDEGADIDDEADVVGVDDGDESDDPGDIDLDDNDLGLDPVAQPAAVAVVAPPAAVESDVDDDVLIVDEVEASLDIILAERMRSGDADSENDDEADEDDDTPSQLATVIPVRRPEEFLCQSCFLLKPPGQLADVDHQLCRDCA